MITITIILILIISLVSITAFNQPGTMSQLQFNAYRVYHHKEYYRLLTHAFVHAGWEHLIVNMIVLWSFGTAVEHYFRNEFGRSSSFYFIVLFVGSVLFSTLWSLAKQKDNRYYNAVGASGAVSAILFTAIFFDPWNPILFFGILPMPGIIFGALYLYYSYYMSNKKLDNIGHEAHFIGAVFGLVFPILLRPSLLISFFNLLLGRFGQ